MKALRFAVLAVALFATIAGFAQQGPVEVWRTNFTLGGNADVPSGISVISQRGFVVNGWQDNSITLRSALTSFSEQGIQSWTVHDNSGTASWTGQMTTLGNSVIWASAEFPTLEQVWLIKTTVDGQTEWRTPIGGVVYLGNYNQSSFIAVVREATDPRLFVFNTEGIVIQQFSLPERMGGIVTIRGRDDLVWIGFHITGGVVGTQSYALSLFRLSSGERLWRTVFADVVRGFFDVSPSGVAFVGGTKVVDNSGGYLAFHRSKVLPNGTVEWSYEHFTKRTYRANRNNWTNNVVVIGSGPSEQVVITGAIEKSDTGATANHTAYAMGFKASNGDSLWSFTSIAPGGEFSSNFFGAVRDGDGWVMVKNTILSGGGNRGTLFKFLAPTLAVQELSGIPESFSLSQNYPNPFNPSTTIRFELLARTPVRLTVYDALGREVATLVNETLESGVYETKWDATGIASGMYFYRLTSGTFVETRKMVLLK